MRILLSPAVDPNFRTPLDYNAGMTAAEYMTDSLFHGLRSLFGPDVVDSQKLSHVYKGSNREALYGRGFTLYGLLEDIEVDRTDIAAKVRSQYFDLIIVPVHCSAADTGKIHLVEQHVTSFAAYYPRNKIAFIDTLDSPSIQYRGLDGQAVYFKRELMDHIEAESISYSIPKEKIVSEVPQKSQDFATCIPWHVSTYVFEQEEAYYADYQKSFFGYTCKKGGWDSLRHYEILANGCVPYFADLEKCPKKTLVGFPKALTLLSRELEGIHSARNVIDGSFQRGHIDHSKFNLAQYEDFANFLLTYTRTCLTTEQAAKRLIDRMGAIE